MAITKWFPRLKSASTVRAAARTIFESRIQTVRHYLSLVASRPSADPEHIHQLRVGTRRLGAALVVFKRELDRQPRRRLRKVVRRIRRSAGAVRDLDVLRDLLVLQLEQGRRTDSATIELVTRGLDRERLAARRALARGAERWAERFEKASKSLIESLAATNTRDHGSMPRLAKIARRTLPKLRRRLANAGGGDLNDLDRLHQLRIAAKRLRYAMELLGHCFPATFRRGLYGDVEMIQEELGAINDLRNLLALVPELPNTETRRPDRSSRVGACLQRRR